MYYPKLDAAVAGYLRVTQTTQAELAERLGMAPNTFAWKRRGEKGGAERDFTVGELARLAQILDMSLDELVEGAVPHRGGKVDWTGTKVP